MGGSTLQRSDFTCTPGEMLPLQAPMLAPSRAGEESNTYCLYFGPHAYLNCALVNRNTEGPTSPLKAHAHSCSVSVVLSHCYCRRRYFQQETGAQGVHVLGKHSDIKPTSTLHPPAKDQVGERLKLGRGKEGMKQACTGGSRFSKGRVASVRSADRQEQSAWVGRTAELGQMVGTKLFPGSQGDLNLKPRILQWDKSWPTLSTCVTKSRIWG